MAEINGSLDKAGRAQLCQTILICGWFNGQSPKPSEGEVKQLTVTECHMTPVGWNCAVLFSQAIAESSWWRCQKEV